MGEYVSLIIDIENSKRYDLRKRNEVQRKLLGYSEWLNRLFGDGMKYAVTFSAGDELQGLFLDVTTAVMYFRLLEILLKPVNVRGGIGVGEWTVKIKGGLSTQQDGPAYHRARQAITEAHGMQLHNLRICSGREDVLPNFLVNAASVFKQQQIDKQNYVLTILELLYPFAKRSSMKGGEDIHRELMTAKHEYVMQWGRKSARDQKSGFLEELCNTQPRIWISGWICIDGCLTDAEEAIRKKNMAAEVAEILGCSRQNADKIIKRGNANKIRELDLMALQYVEKWYGG